MICGCVSGERGGVEACLDSDWVSNTAQELDMGTIQLSCALSTPEEVATAVIPAHVPDNMPVSPLRRTGHSQTVIETELSELCVPHHRYKDLVYTATCSAVSTLLHTVAGGGR